MTDSEQPPTGRSLGWSGLGTVGTQFVQFVGLIVLARILTPADYGLAALASTVTAFAVIFVSSGVGAFVVHAKTIPQRLISTVFWINAALAAGIAIIVAVLSPVIAAVFAEPSLTPLLWVCAGGFLLGTSATHLGLLERAFRFKAIALIDTAGAIVAIITTLVLALLGAGALAIVIGTLCGQGVQLVGYWTATRWRPSLVVDRRSARALWRYAGHVMGFSAVNYWSRNLDNLVIGWGGNSAVLGQYTRSYTLMLVPVNLIPTVVGRVLLATIARIQDDLRAATRLWSDHMILSVLLGLPVAAVLAGVPRLVLTVLLGVQWGDAWIFLSLLAIGIPPQLILRATGALLQALGRTRAYLLNGLIGMVIMITAILVGYWLGGAYGVVVGVCIAFYLQLVAFLTYAKMRLRLEIWRFIGPSVLLLVCAGAAGFAAALMQTWLSGLLPVAQLVVCGLAVLGAYGGLALLVARRWVSQSFRLLRP